jgi:hypothetical protein
MPTSAASRRALDPARQVRRDPAAVEIPGLGVDADVAHIGRIDGGGIEGQVILQRA